MKEHENHPQPELTTISATKEHEHHPQPELATISTMKEHENHPQPELTTISAMKEHENLLPCQHFGIEIDAFIPKPPQKTPNRCFLVGCGCTAAICILAFSVLLIITLTVYRYRTPIITINSFSLTHLGSLNGNVMLVADLSIKNPNIAKFRFSECNTGVYYGNHLVGLGQNTTGTVPVKRTIRFNATMATDLVREFPAATPPGTPLPLRSSTKVRGMVKILWVFKHPVDVLVNCSIAVLVANQLVFDQHCDYLIERGESLRLG